MPVRIKVSEHEASVTRWSHETSSSLDLLKQANSRLSNQKFELYRSSFDTEPDLGKLRGSDNGFVRSIITAYSRHHHLIIRPDDVWFAALSQFSNYVNAHAEELRDKFVNFDGQKELKIEVPFGDRYSLPYGNLATIFSDKIQGSVVDPELQDWMIPSFTTSTEHDKTVAAMIMMATVQKYFTYGISVSCGIPSVTLLGEKEDYEALLAKVTRFQNYGQEPTQFSALLQPIVKRMISAFDNPGNPEVVSFWQRVLSVNNQMSGVTIYSGWLTAFNFWKEDGTCFYQIKSDKTYTEDGGNENSKLYLKLDDACYHHITQKQIVSGWAKLPLTVTEGDGIEYETTVLAGSVGIALTSSGDEDAEGKVGMDTMQPKLGWYVYERKPWRDPFKDPAHVLKWMRNFKSGDALDESMRLYNFKKTEGGEWVYDGPASADGDPI